MSIFISDHQKLLIRAKMFRNMQDISILLIQLVLDSCNHSFICLNILFNINFEVCVVKNGSKKSLISGIKEQAHHILRQVTLQHPPSPLPLVSKSTSTNDTWRKYNKGANYTLTAANGTESFKLPAMLSVESTSSV